MRTAASFASIGLALVALATGGLASVGSFERPLTLDEAIALALEKNEGIDVERASLASAEASVSGAKGAYDPLLELGAGFRRASPPVNSAFSGAPSGEAAPTTRTADGSASIRQLLPTGGSIELRAAASRETTNGTFALLTPAYGTRVGVEFRQPLLRDRAVDAARLTIRVAASDRRAAAASLRREVADTVAGVERAYWSLVAARRETAVREEALRLAEEQLSETGIRVEKGVAPETEIAQPRAELERRRGELLASREAASRAENAMKLLILGDGDTDLWHGGLVPTDAPETSVAKIDVAEELEQALSSRPELDVAEAFVERRKAESAFARDGVRPALDAVVSYDRLGLSGYRNPSGSVIPGFPVELPGGEEGGWGRSFDTLGDGDFDDAQAGLVFRLPLGNRTAKAQAVAAKQAERQAGDERARARKAIRAEVLDAAAAVETAGGRIEAARAAREAAQVQLSAERDRFDAGLSTNFLVLTRQNDLSRARLDEIAALTDYRKSRAEMARATGSLLEDRGIRVDDNATQARSH